MNRRGRAAVGGCVLVVLFAMLVGPACPCDVAIQDPAPWHATMQERDGRWPANEGGAADPADLRVGAWMLLALLSQHRPPETATKTATWLVAQQDAQGRLGLHTDPDWLLDHAIATCAVIEALPWDEPKDAATPALAAVAVLQRELTRQRPVPGVEVRVWSLMAVNALRAHRGNPRDPARATMADALQATVAKLPALPKPAKDEPARQRCARLLFQALLPDIWAPNWSACWPKVPQDDPLAAFYAMVAAWYTGGRMQQTINEQYAQWLETPVDSSAWSGAFGKANGRAGATALHAIQVSVLHRNCRLTCVQ